MKHAARPIEGAAFVTECEALQPMIDFFVDRLDFRLERISPADDPKLAELAGHGLRILIRRGPLSPGGILRLCCADPEAIGANAGELFAPNGLRIEVEKPRERMVVPPLLEETAVTRAEADWIVGRAGMSYRDLVPGRLGGRFIASNIRVEQGGPVPDYVHYHAVRFQLIFCTAGWVRLVYEDQGEPFVLKPGDCVLQPPEIRHRVLECSAGLEVVEVASPASHDTFVDHDLVLPNGTIDPDRYFGAQRFVWSRATEAAWALDEIDKTQVRSLGMEEATGGLVRAHVRRVPADLKRTWTHGSELGLIYVAGGAVRVEGVGVPPLELGPRDSLVVPGSAVLQITATEDSELFEVLS